MTSRLICIEQIASMLQVPTGTACQLARSPGCPAPVAEHSGQLMWSYAEIIDWVRTYHCS